MTAQQSSKNTPTNNRCNIFPHNEQTKNPTPWLIGTHNTRSLSDTKKTLLLDFCHEQQIDILGITETWLPSNHRWHDPNKNFKIWLSKPSNQYIGSGVGFIISNKWAQHVYNIVDFQNRCILIDLAFKGKIKYRILNIYNPANPSKNKLRKEIINWTRNAILEAENQNSFTIIMGDLNEISNSLLDCTNPKH